MSRVVFDIETLGRDIDSLDTEVKEYFFRSAVSEEEKEEVHQSLSLYPQTAEIIAIGMYNPDTDTGTVYFQAPGAAITSFEEEGIQYIPSDEKGILESFWEVIPLYDEFVTYNGRGFDCPFIIVRSAVHRIKATRDLMPYRYNGPHIDLLDQLSFYGASRRKFSLDIWCRTMGIRSPKAEGVKGDDVKRLWTEKKYTEIARYCARDIRATADLMKRWNEYMRIQPSR